MTIEVKNCISCPFVTWMPNSKVFMCCANEKRIYYPNAIAESCPLKTEPITVKIKEDEN